MAKATPRFADNPAVAHQKAVIANLKKNTGKTPAEWAREVTAVTLLPQQ